MPAQRLTTTTYPEAARKRLGNAVAYARLAAGFNSRPEFALEANISKRTVDTVESGHAGVGVKTLFSVGRTLGRYLRHWSERTPERILNGHPAPPNDLADRPSRRKPVHIDDAAPLAAVRVGDMRDLFRAPIGLLHRQGMPQAEVRAFVESVLNEFDRPTASAEPPSDGTLGQSRVPAPPLFVTAVTAYPDAVTAVTDHHRPS